MLVGLQDLRDGDGETEGLAQVHVLLLQGHQTAAKQVLVLLGGGTEHLGRSDSFRILVRMCEMSEKMSLRYQEKT